MTGGGILSNLTRSIPHNMSVQLNYKKIPPQPIFEKGLICDDGEVQGQSLAIVYDSVKRYNVLEHFNGTLSFGLLNAIGGFFNENSIAVNGMKPFLKSNRFGYKSKDETLFIPAIYEDGFDFYYNDLAYVKINNRWGYIDKLGNQYWED